MPLMNEFLTSAEYYLETLYFIEFRLYRKDKCNILCKKVGTSIQTPMIDDDSKF